MDVSRFTWASTALTRATRAAAPFTRATNADPDVLLPAGTWAGCTGVIVWVSGWWLAHESRSLATRPTATHLVLAAVAGAAALLVFLVGKRTLVRPQLSWWFMGVTVAVLVAVVGATPSAAAYFYPAPADRYDRELGGPGKCLGLSPYATEDGHPVSSWMTYLDPALPEGRLVVQPLDKSVPALALDHAVRGGTHRLTAADEQSAAILRTYGC